MEQKFSWALTSGPIPYRGKVLIPKGPLNDQMNSLENPVEIRMRWKGSDGETGSRDHEIIFKKIFLLEPKEIDEFTVLWELADVRYLLRGQKLYFLFNATRLKNEFGQGVNVPSNDPAVLRAPFEQFSKGRYIPDTVKNDGRPFNMLEILEEIVRRISIRNPTINIVQNFQNINGEDGSYILENIRSDGNDIYSELANLLAKSRLQMGINEEGDLYFYSIDFFDQNPVTNIVTISQRRKDNPSQIYKQELSRIRPRKIRVRFEKMHEIIVKATEPEIKEFQEIPERPREFQEIAPIQDSFIISTSRINNRKIISCVNVIQAPFVPTTATRPVNVGEFLPIKEYIGFFGLTEEFIRKNWWSDFLTNELSRIIQGGVRTLANEVLAQKIVAEIKNSYRQIFMIDPHAVDLIDRWDNKKVSIIDNFSAYRPSAPVWADYTIVPRVRSVEIAKTRGLHSQALRVWKVDVEDPNRENPTAGAIRIISQDLGVFKIVYPPSIDNVIDQIIPSGIDNPPQATPAGITSLSRFLLTTDSPLSEDFTMESQISVKWKIDPISKDFDGSERYHDIEFDYNVSPIGDALGPDIDFLSRREPARVDLDGIIVNLGILEGIANAEQGRIFNQFIDRFVGKVHLPGFFKEIFLNGNLSSISYICSPQGIWTEVNMEEVPLDPTIEQQLPSDIRSYLFKQLENGGP